MPQSIDRWIGRQLGGRYVLRKRLGGGGSGSVYAAWDETLEREVALKLLMLLPGASFEMKKRFDQEAKLTAQLNHPHIVPIYDRGEDAGVFYIAMRRLPGQTLRDRLNEEGLFSQREAIKIAITLADALFYAHNHGIVHRDLKPANVLFDEAKTAMLVDFGIAKALGDSTSGDGRLTLTGTTIGTPPYMSPEQAAGEQVDHRSDIYSLGVVLYQMVTGRPPFVGSPPTVMQAHLFEVPPLPHTLRPDINPKLEQIILKALAKKRAQRFNSTQEMSEALQAVLEGRPTGINFVPLTSTAPTRINPAYPSFNAGQAEQNRPQASSSAGGIPIWSITIGMLLLLCIIGGILTSGLYLSDFSNTPTAPIVIDIPTVLATNTATERPTESPTPMPEAQTATPEVSATVTVEATASATSTPTQSATPSPEAVLATESPTVEPSATEQPTQTPTVEPSATEQPTQTPTFTATATELPTQTPTFTTTPTEQPTQTPTKEATSTPRDTPTPSSSPTIEVACQPTNSIFADFLEPDLMGCTTEEAVLINNGTYQRFENGFMIHDPRPEQDMIIVFDESTSEWLSFANEWEAGMDQYACEEAESAGGPQREFSVIWCQNPDIREALGNRILDEIANPMTIQAAEKATLINIPPRLAKVALLDDNTFVSNTEEAYPSP